MSTEPLQSQRSIAQQEQTVDEVSVADFEETTFPEPIDHGLTVYVQLADDNRLYDEAVAAYWDRKDATGRDAHSDHPWAVGRLNASWTDNDEYQSVGHFSTGAAYGGQSPSGDYKQHYAQVFNLYEDVSAGSDGIANNVAKTRVEVHERRHSLVTENGNQYTWPSPWNTSGNQRMEGTCLKIQGSYDDDPMNMVIRAFELLYAGLGDVVKETAHTRVRETCFVTQPERYHRTHIDTQKPIIETLKEMSSLVATGDAEGREHADIQKGHYEVYGFDTDNFGHLGFDERIEYEYDGETRTVEVDKVYVKHYLHKHQSANMDDSNPLKHGKTETKLYGAYPIVAHEAVQNWLSTVQNAIMSWAGIEKDDLITDARYDPAARREVTTESPTGFVRKMLEMYADPTLRRSLIGKVFSPTSKAYHDILALLSASRLSMTYDEISEETGLARSTTRKYVNELNAMGILDKTRSYVVAVTLNDNGETLVDDILSNGETWGSRLADVADRAKERAHARRQRQKAREEREAREAGREELKDNSDPHTGPNGEWVGLDRTPLAVRDLGLLHDRGSLREEDVALRR
jgi:Mn-dependent DtxR family transcriptional regulator